MDGVNKDREELKEWRKNQRLTAIDREGASGGA